MQTENYNKTDKKEPVEREIDWSEIDELARKVALGLMKPRGKNVDKSDS